MRDLLENLVAAQRALETAQTREATAQALTAVLCSLLKDAAVQVVLDKEAMAAPPDCVEAAIESAMPIFEDDPRRFVVPLMDEEGVQGAVCIQTAQPPGPAEIAATLAYARIAADTLKRLSWRATPHVFQQLVENANVAIDVADLDGVITYANRAAARLYGYESPDDLIGRTISERYHDDSERLVADELIRRAQTPEGWIGEVTHKHQNGSPIPVKIAVFGLRDLHSKLASYGAIIQDMSETQHLLTSLKEHVWRREALNFIGTLLSSSLDRNHILRVAARQIVELLDVDHCSIAVINETGEVADLVAEYPVTDLQGAKIDLRGNPVYEAHRVSEFFISLDVANDERLSKMHDTLRALDIQSMLVVRLEVKGKLIGSIGLDSIGRKRVFSREDIEACRALANQIGLAIENADLYTQAVAANRLKSQFLATMSHELRTPLNAILGYTEMVLSGTYGPLTDRVRDRLNRVYRNGQQLLEMINDVLDLSKIEAGEMRLSLEPLELAPLILSAVGSVAPQVESKHLHLAVEIPANMPCAIADSGRLRQMVINLLSNAVKFTREGTITVRLQHLSVTEGIILEHPVLPGGEWVTISVEDTGIGIAPENFDIIFDAFRQVDGSTAREFGGTGLGLAITRQLAEMQGGKLWVQSELGRGSVFTLALPAASVAAVEGKA